MMVSSPDGTVTAEFVPQHEYGMGGPLAGEVRLSNGHVISGAADAFMFSDDSRHLAVVLWATVARAGTPPQELVVFDVATGHAARVLGVPTFSIQRLTSFDRGVVRGELAVSVGDMRTV